MNQRAALVQPDGSFTIGGLTPGEYRLPGEYLACAMDFIEPGQERDVEFLRFQMELGPFRRAARLG